MKTKRQWLSIACAFACVFALVLTLAGCGGVDAEAAKKNFVGSWELYSADFEGEDSDITHDEYETFSELFDMHITIDFDDQGNFVLDTMGQVFEGTWEVVDANTIKATVDNSPAEIKLTDGQLVLDVDGEVMIFDRVSETPNMDHEESSGLLDIEDLADSSSSSSSSSDADSEASDDAASDVYVAEVTRVAEKNVTICDDSTVTIKVTAVGEDFEGDTGYLMTITNHTDQDVYLICDDAVADGTTCEPTLYIHMKPGDTRDAFMFFDQDEVMISESTSCTTVIGVFDSSKEELLGMYDFEI